MLPFLVYEYWKWMKVQTILPKECCSLLIFRGHRSPFLFQHGAGNLIGYSGIVPFKFALRNSFEVSTLKCSSFFQCWSCLYVNKWNHFYEANRLLRQRQSRANNLTNIFEKDAKSPILTNILADLAQWIDLQISFLSCCFQATCKTH